MTAIKRMRLAVVVAVAVWVVTLSQSIECNNYREQASAGASALASGNSAYATSAATAGGAWGQPVEPATSRRSMAAAAARAAQAAQVRRQQEQLERKAEMRQARQLEAMLHKLIDMEESETSSLSECSRWDHLNSQYIEQVGGGAIDRRPRRRSELIKRRQCDELYNEISAARNKLDDFRRLSLNERDHFEFISQLVNQYVDLRRESETNPHLLREFDRLQANDEQVRISVENLDSFIGFMREKLALGQPADEQSAASTALSVASATEKLDEIEELDRTIKSLVDREESLSQQESEQLAELGDILEKILDEGHVRLHSARFRYLTGTLDATRAVILRKLRVSEAVTFEPNDEQFEGQQPVAPPADDMSDQEAASVGAAEAAALAYADAGWRYQDDELADNNIHQGEPIEREINYRSLGEGASGSVATAASSAAATGGRSLAAARSAARLIPVAESEPFRQPQVAPVAPVARSLASVAASSVPSRQEERQAPPAPKATAAAVAFAGSAASASPTTNNNQRRAQVDSKQLDNNNQNKQDATQTGRQAAGAASAASASSASTGGASGSAIASSFASTGRPVFALRRRFADHPAQQQQQQKQQQQQQQRQ